MRGFERREAGKEDFYNLDAFDERIGTWVKTKRRYESEAAARAGASGPGRYRVSAVVGGKRAEFLPFEVSGPTA